MRPKRLVLIEDDPTIAELLAYNLRQAGYDVLLAADGKTGLELGLDADVDLALVDLMLPELDGMTVSRQLSARRPHLPIIMLTARTERQTVLEGFESGADDYMVKPFDLDELLARIAVRLRRAAPRSAERSARLEIEGLALDRDTHFLHTPDGTVFLKPKEYDLLELFLSQPGRLFSRDEIARRVWQQQFHSTSRTLDVHVRQLRVKLESVSAPVGIWNVRGVGYRLELLGEEAGG